MALDSSRAEQNTFPYPDVAQIQGFGQEGPGLGDGLKSPSTAVSGKGPRHGRLGFMVKAHQGDIGFSSEFTVSQRLETQTGAQNRLDVF